MPPEIKILSETEFENTIANKVANGIFALLVGDTFKAEIIAALNESVLASPTNETIDKVVTWDTTSTTDTIYLEYLSGKIEKINTTDGTVLTATTGSWSNRITLIYTKTGAT